MKLRSFVCWCIVVCIPLCAWPQAQADPSIGTQSTKRLNLEHSARIKSDVQRRGSGEMAQVKVTLRDKSQVTGYISRIDTDSFEVTDKKSGKATAILYDSVHKIGRKGMSTGAKIAIGVGIGAAAVVVVIAVLAASWNGQ